MSEPYNIITEITVDDQFSVILLYFISLQMINRLNNRDYTVTLALRTGFGSVHSCILTLRPVIVCLSVT